jgi:cytochrome c oxidase assembly factor CtaG
VGVDLLSILGHWTWDPSILLGLAALAGVWWRPARPLAYGTGLVLLGVALVSPLDYLADHVLFSAHMLQHLLLLLVIPPLLLVGLPDDGIDLVRRTVLGLGPAVSWIARPFPALAMSTVVVWAWHVPTFYEAALASEPLHALEHLSFLATATLYWWPIARPSAHPFPLADLFQFPYLLAAILASSLLSAVITFAPVVLYPTYAAPAFASTRAAFGLDPLADQVVGGLMMWVGGGLWYILAAGVVLARWFGRPDDLTAPGFPARAESPETEVP